jgi:hypothetical protein
VPRYDKYEPFANGFRAQLAADWPRADAIGGVPYGVGFDATGKIVKGAGTSGIMGVLVLVQASQNDGIKFRAGKWIDVMTSGDIVEWATSAGVAGVAATNYYVVSASGLIVAGGAAAATGQIYVGTTAEAERCIVRYNKVPVAP